MNTAGYGALTAAGGDLAGGVGDLRLRRSGEQPLGLLRLLNDHRLSHPRTTVE